MYIVKVKLASGIGMGMMNEGEKLITNINKKRMKSHKMDFAGKTNGKCASD